MLFRSTLTPTPAPTPAPTSSSTGASIPPPEKQQEPAPVPDWLKKGLEEAEKEGENITPPSALSSDATPPPSPQPGDTVPAEGLDPSLVFATPPPSSPTATPAPQASSPPINSCTVRSFRRRSFPSTKPISLCIQRSPAHSSPRRYRFVP